MQYLTDPSPQDVRRGRQRRDRPGGDDEDRAGDLRHARRRRGQANGHRRGESQEYLQQVGNVHTDIFNSRKL